MSQLRVVITCGGQSKRMGTDKGLIPIQNTCWAAFMADKLNGLNLPVSISINSSQVQNYQDFFSPNDLVVDSENIASPLNGLLSVHKKHPEDDLLLLACDMIDMETETIQSLIDAYQTANSSYDYYVYQNKHNVEPFCAIYNARSLKINLEKNMQSSGYSFQKIINSGNTLYLPIVKLSDFNNYNHRLELRGL